MLLTSSKRGRPSRVNRSEILGRAHDREMLLAAVWTQVGELLTEARSAEDVRAALESLPDYYRKKLAFDPLPKVIFDAVQYREIPQE